jgi:adhesin transport system membrane fusion protein
MMDRIRQVFFRRKRAAAVRDRELLQNGDEIFLTDTAAAVVIGPGRGSHLILLCTVLFFSAALTWASMANIDEVTRGEGKVIPSSRVQVVQNLEGGILTEMLVREGDTVAKGQPLLRLDDIRFASSYRETRSKYLALLASAARLKAEAEQQPVNMPDVVTQEDPALAANEIALFRSRAAELASNRNTLEQQEKQTSLEIGEHSARRNKLARSLVLLREELSMSEPLAREGAISDVEILRLKRSVNETRGELEASELAVQRLQSAHEEMKSKITDLEIRFRTEARSDLNNIESELSTMQETLRSQEDRVSRTLVKSPVRGTVKQVMVTTVGGVIQPGMDLVEIVPLDSSLVVEAHVRPSDIAFLRPEQDATVKLTAYDYAIYGGLPAKLEHISADTITDENGESSFVIRVRTDRSHLGTDAAPLQIIPGMTAMVDILTGEKTVLDYLLKPVLRARERALRER